MTKTRILLFFTFIFITLSGCSDNGGNKENDGKLDIYTTVYPIQYFTEQIGGDHVNVTSIYPPGTDEHTYEPSQKDMMNIADADLFLYIGYGLEAFAKKAEKTLENEDVTFVAVGEKVNLETDQEKEHHSEDEEHNGHHHGDIDPHIWLDPIYAKDLASEILDVLREQEPAQKEQFEKNFEALAVQLEDLHEEFLEVTKNPARNTFIVAHAAYGYWQMRYGIEQISISGVSSTEEPSQRKLTEIVDTINADNIPYILFEQNVNSQLAEIVQAETDIDALHIHNLAVLTDKEIASEATYFTLMKKNVEVLEKALN